MNLWLRLLCLVVSAFWRPRIAPPLGVSRVRFRVWPHDLDTSMHMNNGRYWTIMDLGRTDLLLRSGLWKSALRNRWTPVVSAAEIRFRRELRLFQAFTLETRILGWTDTHVVIEHRMMAGEPDSVAAIALVRAALYDRAGRRFVPVSELMAEVGATGVSPELGPEVITFLAAEDALKAVTTQDPPIRQADA